MRNLISISIFLCAVILMGCESNFKDQATLDKLESGELDYGTPEINEAKMRQLNYQKKHNLGKTNGVVIAKDFITASLNGFDQNGLKYPLDSMNYDKWDFMVVYPGQNANGILEPSIFFYKGEKDDAGELKPTGDPITDVSMPGGGGGWGSNNSPTPPPN